MIRKLRKTTLWGKIKAMATALSFVHKDRYQTESKDLKKAMQAQTTASHVSPKDSNNPDPHFFSVSSNKCICKEERERNGGRGRTGEEGREKKGNKRAPLQEFPLVYSLHTERFKKLPSILPKSPRYATLGFYDCEKGVRRRKCKANFHPFT